MKPLAGPPEPSKLVVDVRIDALDLRGFLAHQGRLL